MSFLLPWLWLGALAVAVPVWLHLRAKPGPVFRFPTLRFLEDQPRPRAAGFRLRDVLLFLARAITVVSLAAGFAWPYLDRGRRDVLESRVHVLDNTLSHRVGGGFEKSRERVRKALTQSAPEVQDAVVELTSRPRVMVGFADDRAVGASRVAALQPSFARGSYVEALRLAQSLLANSLGSRRRILVYSDGQENQWTENETSPPFLEGVEVELLEKPPAAWRPNLSLGDPAVHRFFLGEDAYVDLGLELRHEGPARAARVRLLANGKQILSRDLQLESHPGTATVRGEWRSAPGEWLRGELVIEGAADDLDADDRVFFALPPVREGRVAMLARSPYLRAALAPETMRGRWATRLLDPSSDLSAASEAELPEVLVLEGDYAQSQQVRALALRCLNNGRGVVLFLGRLTPLLAGLLRELGLEQAPGGAEEEAAGFRFAAADHPLFKPFLSGELGDLGEVRVFSHVPLVARQGVPLLFGKGGAPLLFEGATTRGRLLVFAFAMDRRQTDWPVLPSFIPFLDLALQHARGETQVQTSAAPGELLVHQVPPGRAAREVVLRDGEREMLRRPVDPSGSARLEVPASPGIYALTYDGEAAVEALVAVNPSPKESVLRYVESPAAIKAWTVATRAASAPPEAVLAPARLLAREQRLWWWCLLAAAAALSLETAALLASRRRTA